MSLTDPRLVFRPIEYPKAEEYWMKQKQNDWIHTKVIMSADVSDFHHHLTESEKNVIGNVLKSFTQQEIHIEEYWSQKVAKWFPKPEIQSLAALFGGFESLHIKAYAHLNDTLGLDDYSAFLTDPASKAKIDRLISVPGKNKSEIALSLAVFSAFAEGVSLFSSFTILMNFARFNKLKGLGQIVSWSVRDESLHSEAGCWLFRTFVSEFPDIFTDDLKKSIYDAARETVKIEDDFIDKVFELGPIEGLNPHDLKQYIRHRANTKLQDLGLKMNWKNIDNDAVSRITEWADVLYAGEEHQDFFSLTPSAYADGLVDWSTAFNSFDEEPSNNETD